MIREKIFRLHRHKSPAGIDAFGQKIDFAFSKIQALQVPEGWDKLSVSLISSEKGKTVRKSGKGLVKNGTCQWMETLSESIWISKELGQHIFKFLVAMGSSRSGILGETSLDLAALLSSEKPILVSLPLKKCNYGTILEVEIRCLTPKKNPRDEKWKELHAHKDDDDDIENKSEVSDSTNTKSTESCSNNKFGSASRPKELGSRETSFSSRYSYDSLDDSVGRQSFFSESNNLNGASIVRGRQDSVESHNSASYCSYSIVDSPKSDSKNQREECRKQSHATAQSLQLNAGLYKRLKEADDATIEVLKAEAKMWERNARKLAIDNENLRTELSDQFLNITNLNVELSMSHSECHELSQEIDHLKFLLEESNEKKCGDENFELHGSIRVDIQKEFEDEMRFQKELNENLSLQLKKTQESNLELISILQEMEETMEKQIMEIENHSSLKLEYMGTDAKNCRNEDCREIYVDNQVFIHELKGTDIDEKIPGDDKFKLELQESFQNEILFLESSLKEKIIETEIERDVKNLILKDCEVECICVLAAKQQEILNLEAALSRAQSVQLLKESCHFDSSKEIEHLKEKVRELEADCNELTEENLELLFELKESRRNVTKDSNACFKCLFQECLANGIHHASMSEVRKLEFNLRQPVEETKKKEFFHERLSELEDESKNRGELQSQSFKFLAYNLDLELQKCHDEKVDSLEKNHLSELETENVYLSQRISGLEAQLRYLRDSKESSRLELQHSESQVIILQNDIKILEEELEFQKLGTKQKLSEMQKQWSEAQEECTSRVNIKLQATTENLIEECDSLQKFNGELRLQKSMLQNKCFVLEAKVRNFEDSVVEGKSLDSKLDERNPRAIINELESKIKHSEIERDRLAEENSILHMQLKKAAEPQNEVLTLRVSLKEMKSKTQFLEAALNSVSGDYEELKSENVSMVQKISNMQKVVSEAEDCRNKKITLEEKILRLEGDLIAKDELYVLNAEMKNEINRIKLEHGQLHLKLKHAEDIRDDLQKKVQFLEEELKHAKESRRESISKEEEDDSWSMDQRSQGPEMVNVQSDASEKSESKENIESAKNESKISLLEAELQEIRERYLQISLKYAEVEDQREQLVMKVKALNSWSIFPK